MKIEITTEEARTISHCLEAYCARQRIEDAYNVKVIKEEGATEEEISLYLKKQRDRREQIGAIRSRLRYAANLGE